MEEKYVAGKRKKREGQLPRGSYEGKGEGQEGSWHRERKRLGRREKRSSGLKENRAMELGGGGKKIRIQKDKPKWGQYKKKNNALTCWVKREKTPRVK